MVAKEIMEIIKATAEETLKQSSVDKKDENVKNCFKNTEKLLYNFNTLKDHGKDTSFSPEDYYILGKEETEKYRPKNPTFYECKVNKSAMIEYLKELQKK